MFVLQVIKGIDQIYYSDAEFDMTAYELKVSGCVY